MVVREGRRVAESSPGGETTLTILTWIIVSEPPVIFDNYALAMELDFHHRKISLSHSNFLLAASTTTVL